MEPTISYLVCASPRSGSSLLCELLKSTGIAGRPEEYFWRGDRDFWRSRWQVDGEEEYVAAALRAGTTPNGVFGAKVMWAYFVEDVVPLLGRVRRQPDAPAPEVVHALLPNLHYIFLRREDRVRQAVSWAKALQTGIWYERSDAPTQPSEPPVFDFEAIDHLVGIIGEYESAWCGYFAEAGTEPVDLGYEELVQAPDSTVRRVLDRLGLSLPSDQLMDELPLRRQADATSAEWVRRYWECRQALRVNRSGCGDRPRRK